MKAKRRGHDPQFKAKVALEALKGVKTIQEIAKEFNVHPVQVSDWKKTILEGAAGVFGGGAAGARGAEDFERERGQLHAKIGQLTMGRTSLKKSQNSSVCEGADRAGGEKPSASERAPSVRAAGGGALDFELSGGARKRGGPPDQSAAGPDFP
jgi:transposase-like protein